ncbi:MAG TPA: sensor domain-containing diguanylate cyclase [Candidatus Polarisedimenticolia bacterium]|nr:sensor domain-containing diguanylate cyclase [Candidatus Polarisedimenticolia bacterium]
MTDTERMEQRLSAKRREKSFRIYTYTLGACAATVVAWHAYYSRELMRAELLPLLVFSMFIGFAWYFSFTIYPRASLSISLDMSYLMTALCVLPPPLPIMVAFGGAVLGCHLRVRESRGQNPFFQVLSLNTGGMVTTALVGQYLSLLMARHWTFDVLTWSTVQAVVGLFLAYNLTNVAIMVTAMFLKGEPVRSHLVTYFRYLGSLEVFTMPLTLGLALLYAAAGIWGFVPLAATILLASGLLKKLNQARNELSHANEQLQDRSRELRILNTIGREINSSLDPEVVFAQIGRHMLRILDAPHLFLSLYHRAPHESYLEYVARDGLVQPRPDRALGQGFTSWVVEARRPLLVHDLELDRDSLPCAPVILAPDVRSIMSSPLLFNGESIGVLCVESPRSGAYTVDHLSVFSTISQQAAVALENARNFQMATVDQLTRLYLRDFFYRKLSEEQARARRYGSTFTVLMLDLDSFKEINDRMGHLAGDRYLERVGEVIRETMRAADIPCRYGGEEFCVLLPETDLDGAMRIAERIRSRVSQLEARAGEDVLKTTISVGIAAYPADYPGTIQGFIEKADQALYLAKQTGRDRVISTGAQSDPARRAR